ncbi:FMN-binding glutamate synthase family protein [Paradesulfitobacterium aromaticivorans]
MDTALFIILFAAAGSFVGGTVLITILFFGGKAFFRTIVQRIFSLIIGRILQDEYSENLTELWTALERASLRNVIELSLRAEEGKIIKRPLGSPKPYSGYDQLMFIPAQMARLPIEGEVPVDMKVTLGPKAAKPLALDIPLMISGMGYGVALSEEAKIALARAAKQLGTVINSGEGPFLPEERQEAGKYIWQIARAPWSRNTQGIAAADMIEVQMGQGARIGTHYLDPATIKGKAQKLMGISPVESGRGGSVIAGITNPWDWPKYVADLRQEAGGKPIALKIMAGGHLERDLAVAIEAGFDTLVIGGAQGGTHGSSPTMEDDFGIPSLVALTKAVRYLREQGVRHEVSVVAAGGYFTPGECLKALALGADAVYMGTVPLFALVHKQIGKVMPWEPLTQLVYYDSKYKSRLDLDLAAKSVVNVLKSIVMEMEEAVRGLGKTSLAEVGPNDLVALDAWTAEITGVERVK